MKVAESDIITVVSAHPTFKQWSSPTYIPPSLFSVVASCRHQLKLAATVFNVRHSRRHRTSSRLILPFMLMPEGVTALGHEGVSADPL